MNPGAFPTGFSPEDFIRGNERPVRRNPLITSILYYSKDVESFGTGLKRIADACRKVNCRFDFNVLKSGFVVVFYRSVRDTSNNMPDSVQDTTVQDTTVQDTTVQDTTVQDTTVQDTTVQDTTVQDTTPDAVQIDRLSVEAVKQKIWMFCSQPQSRDELMRSCRFRNRSYFTTKYLKPMLQSGQIVMTLPDKPNSRNQKYVRAAHPSQENKMHRVKR